MTAYLTLGWELTPTGDPRYWVKPGAKPGLQDESDLVRVGADTLDSHTAIIAQSGSGKSFFLGRLVEEIVLNTRARCVILDPNGDFRKIHEVSDARIWKVASYDSLKRTGMLPHERSRDEFNSAWSRIPIRIQTGSRAFRQRPPYQRLQLWWPSLSADFLAEDLDPMVRSELYHCHVFVRMVSQLLSALQPDENLIDLAEKLFGVTSHMKGPGIDRDLVRSALEKELGIPKISEGSDALKRATEALFPNVRTGDIPPDFVRRRFTNLVNRAIAACGYVSEGVARYYFGKAREYATAGIVARRPPSEFRGKERVRVVDLPSLPDRSTRLLSINAILGTEWEQARSVWAHALEEVPEADNRVPTFIVVDEAHNLMSSEPRGKAEEALTEQFRTIVAEGRKYGLFLILVTQRPDKVDPLILSECENKG